MNTQLITSYQVVSRWASGIVLSIGILVLIGWIFDIPVLTSTLPGLATMKANSALAFVFASISLWQVTGEYRDQRSKLIAKVSAMITMLIGLITVGEYVFDHDFGIDQLLFKEELTPLNPVPGRMSPATALNFLCLGSALLLIDNRWSNWLTEALAITALMIAAVAVFGYIYGVSSLYQIGVYSSIALHTALTFIVLCLGILTARPEHGLISILSIEGAAGILARRLLPAAIGIPVVLGWLILSGQRMGHYDTAFGIALFALLNVIIFFGLIRWNADMLHRAEVERTQARNDLLDNEKRYRRFFENMHETFVIQEIITDNDGKPVDLRFLDLNPAAERILGKTRSELIGRTRSEIAGRPDPEGVEMASRVASTGIPFHMVRSSPGLERSFESFTYSLGSGIVATLSLDITERKKAEDALRESEANKSSIVESALDCIITIDHQGRILEFNPAAEATFGYTRAEALGKEMAELIIPPPLREQHRRGLAHFLSTGEGPVLGKRIEITAMRADGTEFPIELAITPIKGEDPPVFTGFLRDITEGKRAELAVSASEERFRLIVEAAPSAMIVVDRDGKIDLVNAKAQELFGYRKEELLGRPVEMLVPGRFRSGHANYRQSFFAQPTSRAMGAGHDLFGLHNDGHEIPIEIGLTPYESSEGPFTLALIVDITERKQAEEQIAYQAYLLENVNDAVIGSDENSLIRFWNQGAERIFGWKAEEVLGRSGREILRSEFINPDRETVLKILAEQGRWRGEAILYRKDGSQVIMEVSSITLRDANGRLTGYVSVNRDIAERKQAEEALKVSEERFRLIVEAAPSAIIAVDGDGKLTLVNIRAQELFGYRKEELVGRPVEMLIPERFRSGHIGYRQKFLTQPASRSMGAGRDLFCLHKDGHEVPVEIGLTPYESSEGLFTLALIVDITERKQAEKELIKSEEKYRYLFKNNPHPMWVYDIKTLAFLDVNDVAIAKYGYSRQEFLHMTLLDIRPPEETQRLMENLAQPRQALEASEGWKHRLKDGKIIQVEIHSHTIKTGDRESVLVIAQDITERKQAEQALHDSEERFRLIVEAAPSAMIAVDRDGKIDLVNVKAQELFGYRDEELLGRPVEMLVPERFRGGHTNYRQSFLVQPTNRPMGAGRDLFGLHKDGHEVPIEIGLTPYDSSEGLFTLALIVDITERKEAEKALERMNEELEIQVQERTAALSQANALLQMMLDHMPDHIYFKDTQSRFIKNSISQAKALGLSDPAEAVGKSDFDFFPHARQSFDKEQEIIQSGKPLVDEEERVVWPDGRETWVSTTKMRLLDQAGEIIGTFGISRDITDRKRAEIALQKAKLELEAANKELEAFSYSVSHDLRAPLRSVDGFSQALLEDYGEMLPPDGRNFLERIRSSAQRMAELIDDLLNLSKVTRASMKLVPVDLSQIARGIVAELQRIHPERKVNFNIIPHLKARGDPGLLQAVLENLLNNAWKFTSKREQAEIEFGSKLENDETIYFIRDNGAGFDMAYVSKLFGAFQRLHAMTEYSGTGIGLATVQRIINRHGGRIWAEGAVDQGATFFFTLPALERVRPQAAPIEKDSLDRRVREII